MSGTARDVPAAIIDYYFPETINEERSNFYFNYKSVLEPLKTWAADEIEVSQSLSGLIYGKKYVASGKVQKVGYMNWIRRQALKKKLIGYAKKLDDNKIEIVVVGTNQKDVDDFVEQCYNGSKKSKVDNVMHEKWEKNKPLKVGFEIITEKNKRVL